MVTEKPRTEPVNPVANDRSADPLDDPNTRALKLC